MRKADIQNYFYLGFKLQMLLGGNIVVMKYVIQFEYH